MFIGHFAVGLAGRRAASGVASPSLGTWLLAAQLVDLVWPIFLLLGWETVRIVPGITAVTPLDFVYYPFTHSLMGTLVWAIGFGLVYRLITGHGRNALWLALAVFSHWVLDFLTHRPDLALYPGSDTMLGLELWASVWGTMIIEGAIFAAAIFVYVRRFPARDRVGRYAFWGLIALLLAAYLGAIFGPPPGSVNELAIGVLAMWLLVGLGYWIERHRGSIS